MNTSKPPAPGRRAARPSPRLTWIRHVLAVLVLVFIAVPAWKLIQRWDSSSVQVDWKLALLSIVPLVFGILVQAWGWVWLIRHLSGRELPWIDGMYVHVTSQLARYVPGKVGVPLVRIGGAGRHGVSGRVAGASLAVEMLSWLAAGGVLGLLHIMGTGDALRELAAFAGWATPWALGVGVLVTLALAGVDQSRFPARVQRALGITRSGPLLPKTVLASHAVYWLSWSLHGVVLMAAVGMPSQGALARSGFFILAPVLGFVVLFAPAGVGVREAVLSIGLATVTTPSTAVAAAVLSRGATLVADVVSWASFRATRGPLAATQPPA